MAALAMACGVAFAVQDCDFAAVMSHRGFDGDLDWHNMPMPYLYGGVGAYALTGAVTSLASNNAAQDQILIFEKPVSAATVATLYGDHAPQVFDQTHLVEISCPTVTGSILHRFSYDVEQDKMRVVSFTQSAGGKVSSNGDATFTFTPGEPIARTGKASFGVVVTDARGGYTKATMHSHDVRHVVASPVCEFRYFGALPEFSTGAGKTQKHRNPMAIYTRGAKKPDLLIHGDSRLWYSCNESKPGKILFSEPQVLRSSSQADIETDGAAVLEDNKLVVRRPDGSLMLAYVMGQDVPALEIAAAVKNTTGAAMKLETRHFSLVDYDHDGTPDLVGGFNDGLYYFKGKASFYGIGRGSRKIHDISFEPEKKLIHRRSCCIAPGVGDLDGDGRTELLYGISRGNLMVWMNDAAKPTIGDGLFLELTLENQPREHFVRDLNGAHLAVDDFDGDGIPDMILGGNAGRELVSALGQNPAARAGNMALIGKEGKRTTWPKACPLVDNNHISIGQHFDAGRDAMCCIFASDKTPSAWKRGTTSPGCMAIWLKLTEECFCTKAAASGNY